MDSFQWWRRGSWSSMSEVCRRIRTYSKILQPAAVFPSIDTFIYTARAGVSSMEPYSDMGAIFMANWEDVSRWLSSPIWERSSCSIRPQALWSISISQGQIRATAGGSACAVGNWVKKSPPDRASQGKPTGWEPYVRTCWFALFFITLILYFGFQQRYVYVNG